MAWATRSLWVGGGEVLGGNKPDSGYAFVCSYRCSLARPRPNIEGGAVETSPPLINNCLQVSPVYFRRIRTQFLQNHPWRVQASQLKESECDRGFRQETETRACVSCGAFGCFVSSSGVGVRLRCRGLSSSSARCRFGLRFRLVVASAVVHLGWTVETGQEQLQRTCLPPQCFATAKEY